MGSVESLEVRALLSNLAITQAFLVDGNEARISSPILGERLEIRTEFTSENLAASANFAIRVIVDGVPADRTGLTFGAGFASGSWFVTQFHGFAESGSHTVQVILDALNEVAEDNESDNTLTFSVTPLPVTNLPQKFGDIVQGTEGVDWQIVNFADLDPRPGVLRDYLGGEFTYDSATFGHDAIDLSPGPFSVTDQGFAIYAAADGIVESIHDGEYDRNSVSVDTKPVPLANYVIINHGNGWRTQYWHMRRDSVSVKPGDAVQRGDFLGWIGSSGLSTGGHVHFGVTYNNHPVETMLDPGAFWIVPPEYPADDRHVLLSGFSNQSPTSSEWLEQPENINTFQRGSKVYFWLYAGAQMPGDTRTIRFYRPDGTTYFDQTFNQGSAFYKTSIWAYFITLGANDPLGTWKVSFLQNGVELAQGTFKVATSGVSEIRVEQGTQLIRDERFTPIDFGTVTAGATAPTQSFTIANQGSAPLTLGSVALPAGYQLATSPATTVLPGQTTTLTVRLLTAAAGYFGGELRMVTNDPDEPVFRIWLEGIVETPGKGTLIPGLSLRKAPEGSKFFANVRRTGSTASPVTVALATDAGELTVPATVTIPGGATFVNFEIQAVQDFVADGDQRVVLTASSTGLTGGRNEILVQDVLVGRQLVTESGGSTSVSESGVTDQVSVSLTVPPTSDVVVDVISDNPGEVTTSPASLVFSSANWSTPQSVTISAVDDFLIDGTRTTNVRFAVRTAESDRQYAVTPVENVAVQSSDNDVAGFEIQESGGTTIAREQAFTDTVSVRLTAEPATNVVFSISNPDPAELTVSPAMITITPAQWNVWQLVTFGAVADGVVDGDKTNDVTISVVAASSDDDFDLLPSQMVRVTTEDVRPDYRITETGGQTTVRENGPADSLSIVLTAQPVSPVVIRAQLPADAEISLSDNQWIFDPVNWNIAQTLQISAVDDLVEESAEVFGITFAVDTSISDAAFHSSPERTIDVTVEDDEPAPPLVFGPLNAVLGAPVKISWSGVANAVSYEVWVNFVTGNVTKVVHAIVSGGSCTINGFNEMGQYRAWVRANVSSGFTTRWSVAHNLNVTGQIALQTIPRYLDSSEPAFSWNTVPTAVRYDLWVDDVYTARSQIIRQTNLQTTSFVSPTPLPMGLYRAWVRAVDARGQATPWSVRQEFFIAPRPLTDATPLSTFDRTPTLRWEAVDGARSYEVWLRDSFTGADLYRVRDIRQAEWTVPADLTVGRYQWWVRAFGDYSVTGLWSTSRDLWVGGRPAMLTATPAGDSLFNFGWAAVEGAFQYQLQVDRIDVSQVRVIRNDSVLGTSYQTPAALAAGTYRVWVRAISASGEMSLWSREADFTVTQAAPEELPSTPRGMPNPLTYSLKVLKQETRELPMGSAEFAPATADASATAASSEIVAKNREHESGTNLQEFAGIARFRNQEELLLEFLFGNVAESAVL